MGLLDALWYELVWIGMEHMEHIPIYTPYTPQNTNVKSKANWAVFQCDFTPGYENIFQDGVNLGLY